MTYAEQIKHPNWQKKRLEVLEANGFACQECGNKDEQLDVHHALYKKGAKIWEYSLTELRCFCHTCHERAHILDTEIKSQMILLSHRDLLHVLGYIDGLVCAGVPRHQNEHYGKGFIDAVRTNDDWLFHLHEHFLKSSRG